MGKRKQLLARHDRGLAGMEDRDGGIAFLCRGFKALNDGSGIARKIERIEAELTILRARQINANAIALHGAADAGGDFAEYLAEIELGDDLVGEVEQELQALLSLLRGAEGDRIAHGEGNLAGDQAAEADLFG